MTRSDTRPRERRGLEVGPLWTAMEWFLGIVGAIAAFLGVFILVGNEDSSIGIGGDLSWRIGDIDPAWAWGLLIGGGVFLLAALGLVIGATRLPKAAAPRRSELSGLIWHAGVFAVVNAFIWFQDIVLGEGLYAYWVTIPWGIGLAIHGLIYYYTREEEKTVTAVESVAHGESSEEKKRDLQPH